MTKLAILIGVSKYDRLALLSACGKDVELMQEIISHAGPFDDVLSLTGDDTRSASFKTKITAFFKKHGDDKNIEELLYYYSGHGMTYADSFQFLLSDYDEKRISTTCYSNTELDETIKSLNPALTIKIIDACQSGQQYIKDAQDFGVIFDKGNKNSFENLYFLFSSASDQASYCDSQYSHFTKSLAAGIVDYENEEIRYRDLIDFATDAFQNSINQKPFFVTQGNNTEIFGTFSETAIASIRNKLNEPQDAPSSKTLVLTSIADSLRNDAMRYLALPELYACLEKFSEAINAYNFPQDIQELFEVKHDRRESFSQQLPLGSVAEFVKNNSEDVLAHHKDKTIIRRVAKTNALLELLRVGDNFGALQQPEYVNKEVVVPHTYEHLVPDLPYTQIDVSLISKLPNVPDFVLSIVYVLTATSIHLFSVISEVKSSHLIKNRKTEYFKTRQNTYSLRELLDDASNALDPIKEFDLLVMSKLVALVEKDKPDEAA